MNISIDDDFIQDFESDMLNTPIANGKTLLPDKVDRGAEVVPVNYNTNTDIESVPRIFSQNEMVTDFIRIRDDMIMVIEGTKELLKSIPMTVCVAKPSMIAAVASLNGTINANGKLLIEIHEKIQKMQRDVIMMNSGINPDQPNVTVNNLSVNTKDLNSIIEDIIKKEKSPE
jgi:hypothetical protein